MWVYFLEPSKDDSYFSTAISIIIQSPKAVEKKSVASAIAEDYDTD